ncbi:large subunit ribosomal protein L24 [Thermosporothrix hazakensis]|jgi:large subunit ribosomal protein L24|uniref:Large ribosomal subunit protein uL24 n=2 Tax=Thermosporothrix TaxID=768650 RepID=A0A326U0S6_THEHA|nr:50S ribosomal protein L24 [Thermosporothrix hazakensis]PZW23282.1 large subunit ribosomal protein L24 [Thermosporothrix hazakensis]BBH89605.1 50S ribosomal protein L24 [Thermosporothrix sp. COM3]GCE47791.1 50S ribosomal protein L24 [Thermosporothrix hazakensis]
MAVKQKIKKPLHLAKLRIKKGDTVLILAGKDKGKEGTVSRAIPQMNKVIVEGLNTVKKHVKPRGQTQQGGIIEKAMPIHVSNVMLKCTECNTPTRVGIERREMGQDKKMRPVRVCKKCGKVIQDRTRSS